MKTEIEVDITPMQLAELYVHWSSQEQANFLNLIGEAFRKANFDSEGQCCYIAQDINKNGRDFLYTVANFHKVRGIPTTSPKNDLLLNYYHPCDSLSDEYYARTMPF